MLAKIVAANAAPVRHDGVEMRATVSIGASVYPGDAQDGDALRKQADLAMYAAKAAGGSCYRFYRR